MYVNGLWVIGKTFRVEALIIKCTLFISFWSVWLKSKKLPKKLVCLDEGCMNYLCYPKTLGTFRDIKQHWEWLSNQHVPCLWFRLSYGQWYRHFSCWPSISNPKQKKRFSGVSSSRESPTEVEIAAGITKVSTTLEMTGVPEVSTIEWYQKAKSNPKWAVRLLDRATQHVGKLGASSTASSFRKMNPYEDKRKESNIVVHLQHAYIR